MAVNLDFYDEQFFDNDPFLNPGGGDNIIRIDDFGGGGGGGPITSGGGGGTGSTGTKTVLGCTNPLAKNYDRTATKDDGSCIYRPPELPVVLDKTREVYFQFKTLPNEQGTVTVDGVKTDSKSGFRTTEKELLTPKIVTLVYDNPRYTANETYKLSAVQRTLSKEIRPVITKDFDDDIVVRDFEDRIKFSSEQNFRPDNFSYNIDDVGKNPNLLSLTGFGNTNFPTIDYERPSTGITFGFDKYLPPREYTKPPISFGNYNWTYYEVIVERRIKSTNQYEIVPTPLIDPIKTGAYYVIPISFTRTDNNAGGPILVDTYTIDLASELQDGEIGYELSDGRRGTLDFAKQLDITLKASRINGEPQRPTIKLFAVKQFPHDIQFSQVISVNNKNPDAEILRREIPELSNISQKLKELVKGSEATFELVQGVKNFIRVSSDKINPPPSPTSPILRVDSNNIIFNIANSESISVGYSSRYADRVLYTLGNVKREIEPSGTITLKNEDFINGVGRYTMYLQPISIKNGSGKIEKVTINVQSKDYLPGPDITHINYPQNIKGADFKEYNVDFDVSWQSVNTNYILIYAEKVTDKNLLRKVAPAGNLSLNVGEVLRTIGSELTEDRDKSVFKLLFIPYNEEGDERTAGKTEQVTITFDKGDLKLRRPAVINDFKSAFIKNLNPTGFDELISPLLTHYLHLGSGDNKLIGTWGIDDTTFAEEYRDESTNQVKYRNVEKSLVLKLYEPLPPTVTTNDLVWVSKVHSIPLIDQITIIDDVTQACTPLTPNFDLDIGDDIGYQILDDLISSGSATSTDVVNQFISSSGITLDNLDISFVSQSSIEVENGDGLLLEKTETIDYNWKEFVKYSSAEERARNFYYKVQLIEHYQSKYNLLTSGSGTTQWTGSISVLNEANKQLLKISEVKNGFDAFEKYLYTTSGSLTYPGAGLNELSASDDSVSIDWLNGIIDSGEKYDSNNTSRFVYNLPEHIQNDENGQEFILFFDMIGQHFDILWTHIRGISKTKNTEHKKDIGIPSDLIYHMLESLGWDADMGVQSQFLWEYAFGKHSDGTEVSTMTGKERQQQVWRRLLNNLPYLYKHKGTKRALHAAMSCYGVPASLLTVMEFGGPKDPTTDATVNFTFEDRTAAINISGSQRIDIPWKEYTETSEYPNSVELRFNTEVRETQQLISGSDWSLNVLSDTGSLARIQLIVGSDSASTEPVPFFNDEYTQIVINRETGSSDVFEVFVKEGFQERLRNQVSASLTTSEKGWTSGSYISIGGTDITGSVDEFRLWTTALSESKVDNHTLLPDAIDGNHVSSSTEDLIFRLDFEYPKNRSTSGDPYIKNVSINRSYDESYATASNFDNNTSYPYHYTPYDRTVTAVVPSSGFNVGNKVRFESQTKITELSYRSRATKKSYDQAPIDSDRLGLFFSPIKEINMDILKSLGSFNIDNYIGSFEDEYSDEYTELKSLRNYYFDRFNLNLYEYIQLVRYIDKSLFDTLESLVPARAKVSSGLLIEPHILERNKTKWNRPQAENKQYTTTIDVEEDVDIQFTNPQYSMILDVEQDVNLIGTNPQYIGNVDAETDINLVGTTPFYSSSISAEEDINLLGTITRNSGSTMGGIEIHIDAKITGSVSGQYDSTKYQQIGMDPESISRLGFGLYGENGNSQRTYFDQFGNIQKDRVKIYLLKQSYTEDVPQNRDFFDASKGREFVPQTKYRYKINILPFTGSDGNEMSSSVGGDIVEVTPLNGYFPLHYRNVGDLTSGLENSFHNGSKQTSATTPDGGAAVVTFTTNPNTLRVNDSGRGSGEPILEVE